MNRDARVLEEGTESRFAFGAGADGRALDRDIAHVHDHRFLLLQHDGVEHDLRFEHAPVPRLHHRLHRRSRFGERDVRGEHRREQALLAAGELEAFDGLMQHVRLEVPEGRLGGAVPGDDAAVVARDGEHRHRALVEEQPIALLALLHALVARLQFARQFGHRGRAQLALPVDIVQQRTDRLEDRLQRIRHLDEAVSSQLTYDVGVQHQRSEMVVTVIVWLCSTAAANSRPSVGGAISPLL